MLKESRYLELMEIGACLYANGIEATQFEAILAKMRKVTRFCERHQKACHSLIDNGGVLMNGKLVKDRRKVEKHVRHLEERILDELPRSFEATFNPTRDVTVIITLYRLRKVSPEVFK